MSPIGEAPGMYGSVSGAGINWTRKKRLDQNKLQETTRRAKFSNLVITKEKLGGKNESKEADGGPQNSNTNKRRFSGAHKWRRTGRGNQKGKKHPIFKITYNKIDMKEKSEKRTREAEGAIPLYTTKEGISSTLFGHSVQQINNRSTFRALFQNPNGINPHPGNYDMIMAMQECHDNCISLIGLVETNREWNNQEQQKQLKEVMHKTWKASVSQTSTSSERFEANYKPGGTVTILCEDHWTCRITEKGEDPWGLGRWLYMILAGKKGRKLLQVNGYRVCRSTVAGSGETTVYKQQYNILRGRMTGIIDPRRQGTLDLQVWLAYYIAMGVEVLLYLDGNEELKNVVGKWCELSTYEIGKHVIAPEHDGSLATLATTLGLVDIIKEQHREDIPATYARGKRRLDYVFATPQVMNSVERSCILPFDTMFGGDHRPILVDFDASKLFGDPSYEIQRAKARGLRLQDPRVVDSYIEIVQEQLAYHKIYEKNEQLKEKSETGRWSSQCVEMYEKMDKIILESVKYADRRVAKRHTTKYEWSPALMRTVHELRYWNLRFKKIKGFRVDQSVIDKLREEAKLPIAQSDQVTTRAEIVKYMREAKQQMYQAQQRHSELRRTYLEELAEATLLQRRPWLADDGNEQQKQEQAEKQLKELIKRENIRKMHRLIGSILKPGQGKGLLQVDIPDEQAIPPPNESFGDPADGKTWKGPWISIKDPEEMARQIAKANIRSYNQAHSTPFASGELGKALGKYAETPIADAIINGEPLPQHLIEPLMEETRRMIHTLGRKPKLKGNQSLQTGITAAEYKAMYKKMRERISSSPSDKHVGHYIAATRSESLSQLYADMMSYPYKEAFSPVRWQEVLDVMLPKEENNWRISRLRIIQLYESDANQSMRHIFARQMGYLLEDNELVPEMQFGSRPGKMSISPVLQKVLSYDIARTAKIVMGCQENDAIGCYDRIVLVLGYLFCRMLGMPITAIISLAETWLNMAHVIRTAYGRSSSNYKSTPDVPLYGAGQGSTNGPFFWLIMFILIHESIDPELQTLVFISACATLVASRVGDAFVDDSHIGATSSYISDPTLTLEDNTRLHEMQVAEDLTDLAQHYERLLWSTGGALNILKCSWTLISWRWKNGRAKPAKITESPATLFLTSGNASEKQEVPRLEPSTAYRTLGVHIAGDGNLTKAKALLRGHAAEFAGKMGPVQITPVTAFYAFQLYLSPKLGYPLPVSTFTFKDCVYIQAPALMVILPKMKLNRNTSRAIIHGPYQHGGLQIRHLYCEQGNGQLRLFLGHLRNRDHTGELIVIAMSYMQIIVGSTEMFLNLPSPRYSKWIERTWLKSLWEFLHRTNLSLEVRRAWVPKMQRAGDSALMSIFIESGYGSYELSQLNRCRLYHQVFFVSDVASANGKVIDDLYRGKQVHPFRKSNWKWPTQGIPDNKAWLLWGRALKHLESNGKLRVQLGEWIAVSHQKWEWQLHPATQIVRRTSEGQHSYYRPMIAGNTRGKTQLYSLSSFDTSHYILDSAEDWSAVTPCFSPVDGDVFSIASSGLFHVQQQPEDTNLQASTFQERIARAHPFFHRLIGPVAPLMEGTLEAIQAYIEGGTLLTCSDGSFDPELGTASQAWLFSDKSGHILWCGAGPIDGNPDLVTSYRSELGGITTILFLIQQIVEARGITSGSIILYCDNQGALDNVFAQYPKRGIYPLLERDYDLLGAARAIWRELPVTVTGVWVKGHYTRANRETKHDLNAVADSLATHFQEHPPEGYASRRLSLLQPDYEAILYHEGSAVTSKFKNIIYSQLFADDLARNIQKKTGWSANQFNCVAWKPYAAAFRGLTLFQKISTAKLSHDLWNTGAQKKLFGQDEHGYCPVCGTQLESMDHVFQCDHPDSIFLKQGLLGKLSEDLAILGTPLAIRKGIYTGLAWWLLQGTTTECPRAPGFGRIYSSDVWATTAYSEQTTLGWGQLLRGRMSKLWGDAYVKETRSDTPRESHTKWTKPVIKLLWKMAFAIWEHRNGVLHGHTVEQQRQIQQETLQLRIQELYEAFSEYPDMIHSSASYLFALPLEQMQLKSRQYLLCWIRSVEVALAYQESETAILRKQARRFFDGEHQCDNSAMRDTIGVSPQRQTSIRGVDISSPESYDLRLRGAAMTPPGMDDQDDYIPPAMFIEFTDSSYTGSGQNDLPLRADQSISSGELADLQNDLGSLSLSTLGGGELIDSEDSSYIDSNQGDVRFQCDYSIGTTELESLAPSGSSSSSDTVGHAPSSRFNFGYSSPRRSEPRTRTQGHSSLQSIAESAENQSEHECTETVAEETGKVPFTPSSTESSAWNLRFPLHAIGAITEPSSSAFDMSPLAQSVQSLNSNLAPGLQVYREILGGANYNSFPLRQPSLSDCSGASYPEVRVDPTRQLDDKLVYHLVNRAYWWLRTYPADNRFLPLSPSIYWAVRSLGNFYAESLESAERAGASGLEKLEEYEWPEPPEGNENYDWSAVPNWLYHLLNMEQLHDWGLKGVREQRGELTGTNLLRLQHMMDLYVQEIPERELDDPPDSTSNDSGSSRTVLIEELSGSDNNEDDYRV